MRTLPKRTSIKIKRIDAPTRAAFVHAGVALAADIDTMFLVVTPNVYATWTAYRSTTRTFALVDLAAGTASMIDPKIHRADRSRYENEWVIDGAIEPGFAVYEVSSDKRPPTVYINELARHADQQGHVDVARDAFLSGDRVRARQLLLDIFPKDYGIVLAIFQQETLMENRR